MTYGASRAFRRWCAATALLVVSWSLPGSVEARVSPMEIVKQQLRKPNFLIMVESPESMQGLPGENPARYNEVGADCQNGDRYCRLYGQPNRCEFSGMGGQGYKFDTVSVGTASQTQTQSQTMVTSTMTVTQTGVGTSSTRPTALMTGTSSGASAVVTATSTVVISQSATGTTTSSATGTQTVTQTGTRSTSSSQTGTQSASQSSSASQTSTQATTQTSSSSQSGTQTASQSVSASQTNTQAGTQSASASQTNTQSGSQTISAIQTNTQTSSQSSSSSQSATQTSTQSSSSSASKTQTSTQSSSSSQTTTQTAQQSSSYSQTATQTSSQSSSSSASGTQTSSQSSSSSASGTQTSSQSSSSSASKTQTASQSASSSVSGTQTASSSSSSSASGTQTSSQSSSSSASKTQTASQSSSSSASATQTSSQSSSSSASKTQTSSQSSSSSASKTQTSSQSSSSSASATQTASSSSSSSGSKTQTSTQSSSSSASATSTASNSSSSSASSTQTATQSQSYSDSNSASGTQTYTITQSQATTSTASGTYFKIGTDASILGYWPLEENVTSSPHTYSDDSGNNNDGTAYGFPAQVTGHVGNAGNFGTGSADYVQVPTLTSAQAHMTVAVWIDWLGTFDVNTRQDFVSFTPGGEDAGGGIRLFVYGNNFYFDNNAALNGDKSPATGQGVWTAQGMNNNTWVLLVGVVDGTNWTLYQYWSSCSIIKAPTAMAYTGATTFNNSSGATWCFGGTCTGSTKYPLGSVDKVGMDEIRIWNRALSATEIANLCTYNYVKTAAPTGTATSSYTQNNGTSTGSLTSTRAGTSSFSDTQTQTATKSQSSSASSSASSTYTNTSSSSSSKSSTFTNTSSSSSSASGTTTSSASSSSSASSTNTSSSSSSSSASSTYTSSNSSSSSASGTTTSSASSSSSASSTNTSSSSSSSSASSTYTSSNSSSSSASGTMTNSASASSSASSTYTNTSSTSSSGSTTFTNTSSSSSSASGTMTSSVSSTSSASSTNTSTSSAWSSSSSTYTNTGSNSLSSTATMTSSVSSSASSTSAYTSTASSSVSGSSTLTTTGSSSQSSSASYTRTGSSSASSSGSFTFTGTSSQSSSATFTGTGTSSLSSSGTRTTTGSSSVSASATVTTIGTNSGSASVTGTNSATQAGMTSTATNTVSQSMSGTATVTQTGNPVLVMSYTDLASNTQSVTGTLTLTATVTVASTLKPVPDLTSCNDPGAFNCTWLGGVTSSYCYLNSTVQCYSNDDCNNLTKGDFCRFIDTSDGSGRHRNDFCASGTTKTCRYDATTPCNNDSQCDSGKGDYCVYGKPVNMCQNTGLWCTDDGLGCDTSSGDACVPATSRMMMVKNAVRRVVLEHAYDDTAVVKIGQMHTYQAGGGSTDNLFPYVKLDSTSTGTSFRTSTRVDTKFLPRSELMKGVSELGKACFSESTGPSSSCTIDYSGGGALATTPPVTYSLKSSGNNSRYAVPTGDGRTYSREDGIWSTTCKATCVVTAGTGVYEGSYYTFSYTFGVPVAGSPSDLAGTGSLYAPKYSSVYLGKSYGSAGNYWYLMDAERTEFVNENKYGAREFSGLSGAGAGLPWSQGYVPTGDEYPLALTGASGDPTSTSATCGASNGAQWDYNVVPMVNDTSMGGNSSLKPTQKALMNAARLDKASYGGFYATGNLEPIACALKNDGQNDKYHSIDNYMSIVQSSDSVANGGSSPCWENHVLMVVDGLPRGPGDVAVGGVDCSADACVYDPVGNPSLTGCNCPAVTKARALAVGGVNVHVIAATTDLQGRNTYAAKTLNNVARAGSTTSFINIPRYAASEDELYYWLNYEMKEALRMTVATTPASAASGQQSLAGVTAGNMLFQSTVELPEWRGSLAGFSIGTATTTTTGTATASVYTTQLAWDAATVNAFTVRPGFAPTSDQQKLWKQRQVFFSDSDGHMHQIVVADDGSIDSASKTALKGLGMGGSETESERIVQWMLGKIDPSDTTDHKPLNPAVMGSVVNSMPIDVGAPGISLYPGGTRFYWDHVSRPELVYLGADDGMLHAFYASNGKEAFAFIPADMVPVIARIYAQGGQRYSPNDHIYGLAGSPKVKNLCVANCVVTGGKTCSDTQSGPYDSGCPDWRTVLVMGEGPGGNHPFALDITDPVESGNATLGDASLLWHVGYKNAAGILAANLGETDSTAAFAFHRTSAETDNRVLMASGYPLSGTSNTTKLIDAMILDGSTPSTAGSGATIGGSGSCDGSTGQEFAVLTDVAVARDNFHNGASPADQNLLAAYVGDTWGTLHQYAPSFSPALDKGGAPMALGCNQPLHFSPAVVQLNRNNSNNPDNSVYLAQVTNSILDAVTVGSSFPASMLVIGKETSIGSAPPALDQTFGTSGLIKLAADTSQGTTNRLCGVTTVVKTSSASDCGTGGSWLPSTARPTGTPVAVVRTDGTGFQLYTTWYDPPKANWDTCPESATSGNSYVTLHEFLSNGTWAQIAGREYPHQYVTGVQFVGSTLFITFGTNATTPNPTTDNFGQTFSAVTPQSLSALSGDRFIKTAWSERMDVD